MEWIIAFAHEDLDWLIGSIVALTAIVGGMLGIRKAVHSIAEAFVKREAEALIAAKVDPVVKKLDALAAQLNNGLSETVASLDAKVDRAAEGQAEMKGALRALTETLVNARPGGRRIYDP